MAPNRADPENDRTVLYIAVGAVAVVFVLMAAAVFALVMVLKHRHLKKKEQEQRTGVFKYNVGIIYSLLSLSLAFSRSESRFSNSVIPNLGISSRYTSSTTLDKLG